MNDIGLKMDSSSLNEEIDKVQKALDELTCDIQENRAHNFILLLVVIVCAIISLHCSPVVHVNTPEQPKAELKLTSKQYINRPSSVLATAMAKGEVCIDKWILDFGDESRPEEHESSCENGSCCGRYSDSIQSFPAIHTYLANGIYTIKAIVEFWGKKIGMTPHVVTINDPKLELYESPKPDPKPES